MYSDSVLPLANAWLDNIEHFLNYFENLTSSDYGYAFIIITLVCAFFLLFIPLFRVKD